MLIEVDANDGSNLDGRSVEEVGFVAPVAHGFDGGGAQGTVAAEDVKVFHLAGVGDVDFHGHDSLIPGRGGNARLRRHGCGDQVPVHDGGGNEVGRGPEAVCGAGFFVRLPGLKGVTSAENLIGGSGGGTFAVGRTGGTGRERTRGGVGAGFRGAWRWDRGDRAGAGGLVGIGGPAAGVQESGAAGEAKEDEDGGNQGEGPAASWSRDGNIQVEFVRLGYGAEEATGESDGLRLDGLGLDLEIGLCGWGCRNRRA